MDLLIVARVGIQGLYLGLVAAVVVRAVSEVLEIEELVIKRYSWNDVIAVDHSEVDRFRELRLHVVREFRIADSWLAECVQGSQLLCDAGFVVVIQHSCVESRQCASEAVARGVHFRRGVLDQELFHFLGHFVEC